LKVIRYNRIPSTNLKAHEIARRGASEWTVVVSEVQTSGRGRRGRKWESRKGGLWFTVILRPKMPVAKISLLQFLASNAARKAVMETTGVLALSKWPNDLVVNSEKLGGILVESRSIREDVSYAIVGIGLNVNQSQRQLPPVATTISSHSGKSHSLPRLMTAVVNNMRSDYESLVSPAGILQDWWANCVHRLRLVQVETPKGVVKGISIGLDPEGSLLVETDKHVVEKIVEGTLRIQNA
jgi:BirA family transcriptional regulator, biotin operon repressor / biotin---[acetyl-CoA-carboxylase] ligase